MPTPKKPTILKLLEGNPGKRPLPREPKPAPRAPECPGWLDADAQAEWRKLVPELERLGLLARIDGGALEGYCCARSRWMWTERELIKHPDDWRLAIAADRLLDKIRGLGSEFGLTPASRSRINLPEADKNDDLDGILS